MNTTIFLYLDLCTRAVLLGCSQRFVAFFRNGRGTSSARRDNLLDIFAPKRVESWRKAGHLKCQAPELMQLIPVLAH
eukprot:7967806-Pyramimonas_sp.AAC.1